MLWPLYKWINILDYEYLKECCECKVNLEGSNYNTYYYKSIRKYEQSEEELAGYGALVKCKCPKCGKENFIYLDFKDNKNIEYQVQKFMDIEFHTFDNTKQE